MRLLFFMVSAGVIVIAVCALYINAILTCTIETTGTYIKHNTVRSGRGKVTYEPVFRYYVKGEEFQGRCLNEMSLSDIQKRFAVGQTYTIYVSNRKPDHFAVSRKVPGGSMIGILVGIGIILLAVGSAGIWRG